MPIGMLQPDRWEAGVDPRYASATGSNCCYSRKRSRIRRQLLLAFLPLGIARGARSASVKTGGRGGGLPKAEPGLPVSPGWLSVLRLAEARHWTSSLEHQPAPKMQEEDRCPKNATFWRDLAASEAHPRCRQRLKVSLRRLPGPSGSMRVFPAI